MTITPETITPETSPRPPVRPFGTHAVLVTVADAEQARNVAAALHSTLPSSVTSAAHSVIPAATSVMVSTTPTSEVRGDALQRLVEELLAEVNPYDAARPNREQVIEVSYDGEDLQGVADYLGLSISEVISRHTGALYTVEFLGFAPGFPYLSGLDPHLGRVPRLDVPRTSVPAGAVGVAAGKTCVYPTRSPGGWHLIGTTSATLFDAANESAPALLAPGDTVRFVAR